MNTATLNRTLLIGKAIESRAEADWLRLSARCAELNAESLEQIACDGTDEEVADAVKEL